MTSSRGRRVKPFPLTIGNDPSLWRYGSLDEALAANTDILSQLIRAGQDAQRAAELASSDADDDDTIDPAAK